MSNDRPAHKQYEARLIQLLRKVFKFMALKQETLNRFVETFGTEKILSLFSKEEILAALRREDMLRQLLAEFGPSQLHQMIDQISSNKSESH